MNYNKQSGFIPLIPAIIISLVAVGGTAVASQNALPGNPLYGIKTVAEKIQVAITPGNHNKAEVYMEIAGEKLGEIEKLQTRGALTDRITEVTERLQENQNKALEHADQAKASGKDVGELIVMLQSNFERQQQVLSRVLGEVPDQAKDAIREAMQNSQRGLNQAIEIQLSQ
ncbi:MAG: DUF5667 domain-containing protein [Candidatus Yanofskybacteria bacterium]|nr:DUF5667 domain-containing protein [Candidatus Yanofskybacteria bacterium]